MSHKVRGGKPGGTDQLQKENYLIYLSIYQDHIGIYNSYPGYHPVTTQPPIQKQPAFKFFPFPRLSSLPPATQRQNPIVPPFYISTHSPRRMVCLDVGGSLIALECVEGKGAWVQG